MQAEYKDQRVVIVDVHSLKRTFYFVFDEISSVGFAITVLSLLLLADSTGGAAPRRRRGQCSAMQPSIRRITFRVRCHDVGSSAKIL